jgi:hypothetical protein
MRLHWTNEKLILGANLTCELCLRSIEAQPFSTPPMHALLLRGYFAIVEMHFLVEETQDLPSNVLSPRFFMIHDTSTCSKDDVAELT